MKILVRNLTEQQAEKVARAWIWRGAVGAPGTAFEVGVIQFGEGDYGLTLDAVSPGGCFASSTWERLGASFEGLVLNTLAAVKRSEARCTPIPGTYAFTAMMMAKLGVGAEEGFDWDAWKDEMKERE